MSTTPAMKRRNQWLRRALLLSSISNPVCIPDPVQGMAQWTIRLFVQNAR